MDIYKFNPRSMYQSYRNQSVNFKYKSNDWFLYDPEFGKIK